MGIHGIIGRLDEENKKHNASQKGKQKLVHK